MTFFLKIHVFISACQSADIMASLYGARVCVNNFSSKTTRPRDMQWNYGVFNLQLSYCSAELSQILHTFKDDSRDILIFFPPWSSNTTVMAILKWKWGFSAPNWFTVQ